MARIYGEIASSALMTFDKSFARSNGQPLDSTEIFYSLVAAQDYAKTDVAYVGQKIVVIETVDEVTTVAHYGIEADNSLKELGSIPVGDGLTIEVVDGKIQLADIEDHATGTYQPFLVDGKIEWREPSETTVEGLDSRLTSAEDSVEALESIVGKEASDDAEATGLVKAVADNTAAIEGLEVKAHEHANKDVIDGISEEKVSAWDSAEQNAKDYTDELANGAVKNNADAIAAIKDGEELDSFADVEAAIDGVAGDVEVLAVKMGEVDNGKTIMQMITEATYDDTELAARVGDNETAIAKLNANAETEGSVDYKIAQAVAAIMENPDETMNSINELVTWINGHAESALELSNQVEANKGDIAELEALIGTTGVETQIAEAIEEALKIDGVDKYALASNLTDAIARIVTLEGKSHEHGNKDVIDAITAEKVAGWDAAEGNAKSYADELNTTISERVEEVAAALEGKVSVEADKSLIANTLIEKLEGIEAGAQVNVIDSVDLSQFAISEAKHLTLLDIAMSKVTGLAEALEAKAEKGTTLAAYGITDAYTKTETEGRIQEVLDGLSDTSETAASVAQALETYKTSNDARVGTIEGKVTTIESKLESIEEGAQANKIEAIKVGETLLSIVDKTVSIPVATADALGVVKSSDAENQIAIDADGIMKVNNVNVNKLVQNDGEYLILNGGAAAV